MEEVKKSEEIVKTKWTVRGTKKAIDKHNSLAQRARDLAGFVSFYRESFEKGWADNIPKVIRETTALTSSARAAEIQKFRDTQHYVVPPHVNPEKAKELIGKVIENYEKAAKTHDELATAFTRGLEKKLVAKFGKTPKVKRR